MKTHFIYSRRTGQIVHTHISDEGQDTSKEGLLNKLDPKFEKTDFEVFSTDEPVEAGAYTVNVRKRMLVRKEATRSTSFGLGGISRLDLPKRPKSAKTIYRRAKQ